MPRRISKWLAAALLATTAPLSAPSVAQAAGDMRGLVIGIDSYKHVPALRGAVADARDVADSLKGAGVKDVTVLLNDAVSRKSVLAAFETLADKTRTDDLVFITLAGHGAQEPERVRGSEPDGMDEVFLLHSFDPKNANGASEKILDKEFNHYIKKIEGLGGRVIFVADTCSGGGLARDVDPRGGDLVYRAVRYQPIKDNLVSVADRKDSFSSTADFQRSLFLAAVDKRSRVPEFKIPGAGYRGALSYAFSRGLDGGADMDGDGKVTAAEMFAYVRQVAHQLSDHRQVVVLESPGAADPGKYVVAEKTRGISVRPTGAAVQPQQQDSGGGLVISPAGIPNDQQAASSAPSTPPQPPLTPPSNYGGASTSPPPPPFVRPQGGGAPPRQQTVGNLVKIAALDGKTSYFAGLSQQVAAIPVTPDASPDLVWDPRTRDVLSGPDIIARDVDPAGLPGVVERTLALSWLKQRATRASQAIRLMPGDQIHRKGTRIEVEVSQLDKRFLVLFNLSGNGAVQLLYPLGSDPPQRTTPNYNVEFQVREPFGSDEIIAVTSNQRLVELERLLAQSARHVNPDRLAEVMTRAEPQGVRIGYVGLFTSP